MMNSSLLADADICEGLDLKATELGADKAIVAYRKFAPFKFGPLQQDFLSQQRILFQWKLNEKSKDMEQGERNLMG